MKSIVVIKYVILNHIWYDLYYGKYVIINILVIFELSK